MVSKPLALSFYSQPFASGALGVACLTALLAMGSAFPLALVAQEKKAEAKSTAEAAEEPVAVQKAAADTAADGKVIVEAKTDASSSVHTTNTPAMVSVSKASVLVGSFTVFLLSVFVGFEIIAKVPPTLHTPLMSGSNAISGITVVGAMIAAGATAVTAGHWFGTLLGTVAVVLATINVVGGFVVTHRMLKMFKKR